MQNGYCLKDDIIRAEARTPGAVIVFLYGECQKRRLNYRARHTMRTRSRRDKQRSRAWPCPRLAGRTRGLFAAFIITSNVCFIVSLIIPINFIETR